MNTFTFDILSKLPASNSSSKKKNLLQLFTVCFIAIFSFGCFTFDTAFCAYGSTFNGQPMAGILVQYDEGILDTRAPQEYSDYENTESETHFNEGITAGVDVEDVASVSQPIMSLEEGIAYLSGLDFGVVDASAGGSHSLAILSDGTLWAWGNNQWGRLGMGEDDTRFRAVPTQVGEGDNWVSVAAGQFHSLGIQGDGTLWAWGNNQHGALGLGVWGGGPNPQDGNNIIFSGIPVQVGNATNWEFVTAAEQRSFAIRSDGTLWSWGWGAGGALGHGFNNTHNPLFASSLTEPTQVGVDTDWSHVSAPTRGGNMSSVSILALKDDGTLWGWGSGAPVAVPPHNNERSGSWYRGFPGQIGQDTWKSVSTGYGTMMGQSHAIRSDGTWWDLRFNFTQQAYDNRQIGTSSDWKAVSRGAHFAVALKNDGTLWQRGGIGGAATIGTPYGQVGTDDDWVFLARESGDDHTLAIRSDGALYGWGHNGWSQLGQREGGTRFDTPVFIMPEILEVDEVAPTGQNVSVNTGYIRIIFSTAVNRVAGVGTVTLQGDELDPSTFIWSEANWHLEDSVLLIPVPDRPMPYDTLHSVVVSGFVSASGGAMREDYLHTFTTVPRTSLVKTLQAPVGTTLPTGASFTFEFEAVQIQLDEFSYSRPVANVPPISNQVITIDSGAAVTAAEITTATGSLNLRNLMYDVDFSTWGGIYVWNITEQYDSSNTMYPSSMSYDDARFQIRTFVDGEGSVEQVYVYSLIYDEGIWAAGARLDDGPSFTNTYVRYTSDTDDNHLEVTKYIEGQFADSETLFTFTLTLTAHELAPIDFPLTATIVDAGGDPVLGSRNPVILATGADDFQLAHDERLVLPPLPLGTTFYVAEGAHEEFAPEVKVIVGGQLVHADSAGQNSSLSTGSRVLNYGGRNAADFTNIHQFALPTGLSVGNMSAVVAVFSAIALAAYFARQYRKRIEQLPLIVE